MKKRYLVCLFVLLACMLCAMPVSAKWVKEGSGYVYYTGKGVRTKTVWITEKNAGMVTFASGNTYCIKKDGTVYKGCLTYKSKTYYFNSKGLLIRNKWIKGTGSKLLHTDREGALLVSRIAKIGGKWYGFNKKGLMIRGAATLARKTYYFRKDGTMVIKGLVRINGKIYFFGSNGAMVVSRAVGRYYFGKKGDALTNGWNGEKYYGADGKYCIGLTRIGSDTYFFNNDGTKLTSASKTVNGKTYLFDANGKAVSNNNGRFENTYYTDPKVDDETLLSAIISAESGNQPYYGQIAVGLVITNRMRSGEFPNTLREVIYAKQQFTPARDGALTKRLKNPALVSDMSKKAAKVVLAAYPLGKYYTTDEKGKRISLEGYVFFMTPAAYQRLGLNSVYIKLQDHVFFKRWSR